MARILISLSGSVTKSAVMAVFRRRVKQGYIEQAVADGFKNYINKNPSAFEKAIKGRTATAAAEALFKARFRKSMIEEKSDLHDRRKKQAEKDAPRHAKKDKNSDVVDRWKEYAEKEELSKEELDKGLKIIKHQREYNKHDGSIENATGASIYRKVHGFNH